MFITHMPSDERVIDHVLSGQRERFEVLVNRYLSTVYAVAYAQTRNHADAEDITQETFLKAFTALDSLRERRKFGPWVVTIARNFALRLWNNRQRETTRNAALEEGAVSPAPDVVDRELASLLREHIGRLDETHREVLLLHYFARKNTFEMAQLLGISRHAAKKRLQRAREHLSNTLLGHIGEAAAPPRSAGEQTRQIMGIVVSTPVAWKAAAGVVSSTAAGTLSAALVSKAALIPAGIAAAALSAVVLWNASSLPQHAATPETRSPKKALTQTAAVADPAVVPAETRPAPDQAALPAAGEVPAKAPAKPEQTPAKRHIRQEMEKTLTVPVSMEFENIHVQDVLEFVQNSWAINVVLDQRVLRPEVKRPSVKENGTDPAPGPPQAQYVTDGMVPYIDLRDIPLRDALTALLRPLGLGFSTRANHVWISTPALIAAEAAGQSPASPETEEKLDRPVSLAFEKIHVSEILEFAADSYNVNLILDYRVVERKPNAPQSAVATFESYAMRGRDRKPNAPQGSTAPPQDTAALAKTAKSLPQDTSETVTDGIIPYINIKNVPLNEALQATLRPLNLAFRAEDGFLWVSSSERVQNEPLQTLGLSRANAALTRALTATPEITFEKLSLASALAWLQKECNLPVSVDTRAVKADAPQIRFLHLEDIPLNTAVALLMRECGLACVAEDDTLFVSTPNGLLIRQKEGGTYLPIQTLVLPAAEAPLPSTVKTDAPTSAPETRERPVLQSIREVDGRFRAQMQIRKA